MNNKSLHMHKYTTNSMAIFLHTQSRFFGTKPFRVPPRWIRCYRILTPNIDHYHHRQSEYIMTQYGSLSSSPWFPSLFESFLTAHNFEWSTRTRRHMIYWMTWSRTSDGFPRRPELLRHRSWDQRPPCWIRRWGCCTQCNEKRPSSINTTGNYHTKR